MNRHSVLIAASLWFAFAIQAHAASCDSLRTLKLPDTTLTSAAEVAAGGFAPAEFEKWSAPLFKSLPAFCRVTATLKPSTDSDIRIEVWMPLTGWNKRLEALGNGGFAGRIYHGVLAEPILRGSAAVETDTGHEADDTDGRWALGHPEKIADWGWRAIHEMAVKAKAIVQAFYDSAPEHSYFSGCSAGGRQGLMEAQRFPADYDGILSGAPGNDWSALMASFGSEMQATAGDAYIPAAKLPAISAAVLKACDSADGIRDGIINDPRACHFDPQVMLCKQGDAADCLTAPQIGALKKIYAGPRTSKGKLICPGLSPGGETGEDGWINVTGAAPDKRVPGIFLTTFMANMVVNDPNWDARSFNLDRDFALANQKQGRSLNATDPNLKAFRDRGGKLILYHGWSDPTIPGLGSIRYFESVRSTMGTAATDSFARLYMVPGMQHCGGGDGPDSFGQFRAPFNPDPQRNIFLELQQWVEKGSAPQEIIATKLDSNGKPRMTRPLCPYPQVAKYKGSGDTNDAANFVCAPK